MGAEPCPAVGGSPRTFPGSLLCPSSSGSGSWHRGLQRGCSSRSPWWCVPAPPAAGRAAVPPPMWRRSCSKSSRSGGVSWPTGRMPCPGCHPRCRCCHCCSPAPAGPSSGDAADSLCGTRSSLPRQPGWGPARRTRRKQSTELLALGSLQEEEEEESIERCCLHKQTANVTTARIARLSPDPKAVAVTNRASPWGKLHHLFKI